MKPVAEQVILLTGATDGIGRATAQRLAAMGARLLIHGRDPERCEATTRQIRKATGNDRIECFVADFSGLDGVRALAGQVRERHDHLDVLVNNAGVGPGRRDAVTRETGREGHELRFTVNYLAPFLLTRLLLPTLAQVPGSRIVNVASIGQAPLDFGNLMLARGYDGWLAYAQSKLALIMFTIELAARLPAGLVTVNALHPGTLLDTKMVREAFGQARGAADEGAEAEVFLATAPELDGVTGKYFDQKRESHPNAQAEDAHARRTLWQISEDLTGLRGTPLL